MRHELGGGALLGEGQLPRGELVGNDSQRVHIRAPIEPLAPGLLRAHVLGRAHDDARLRLRPRPVDELGDAEVEHLHEGRRALDPLHQEDVVRLQIAVDDAALVGGVQRLAGLRQDRDPHLGPHRHAHHRGQRHPLQVLHDEVGARGRGVQIEDADDVLVADEVHRPRLGVEALDQLRVGRQMLVEHLHRHAAADGDVLSEVHGPHAATAQPPHEPEAAKLRPQQRILILRSHHVWGIPLILHYRYAVLAGLRGRLQGLVPSSRPPFSSRVLERPGSPAPLQT